MSFSHLSTIGTLSYNGYTFDGSSEVKVDVRFVMDEAGRTIIYHEHTIEVHAFVQNDGGTDSAMVSLRNKLGHQGQYLVFRSRGFSSNFELNNPAGSGKRDVKWGPKPEVLHWEPVGAGATCEIVWRVVACVPVCDSDSSGATSGVMAMNYAASIGIENGLTTRTFTGYLEIAQTRTTGRSIPDCADRYKYLVNPEIPLGFERKSDWQISDDKSRVNFTISDRQIPSNNPYPVGVVKIKATHRASMSRTGGNLMAKRCTISVDAELPLGVPAQYGWQVFGQLVRQRIQFAKSNGQWGILEGVDVEEEIFGLSHSFNCVYRLMSGFDGASKVAPNVYPSPDLFDFARTGMWQPVAGTDWRLWRTSLAKVFDNRGLAGLTIEAANDVIVDLCSQGVTIPFAGGTTSPRNTNIVQMAAFQNEKPPPGLSFLKYDQDVVVYRKAKAVRQSPLQESDTDSASGNQQDSNGLMFSTSGQSTPDVIQRGGRSEYSVAYVGLATRAGYEIPRPAVKSIGGQTATEDEAMFSCSQVANWFGLPIYKAWWAINYLLPSAPSSVSPTPNLQN